jgi:hypothetical protein
VQGGLALARQQRYRNQAMSMRAIAVTLLLLAPLALTGCYGAPDAARPGVNTSSHTNPADPGAPNNGGPPSGANPK